MKVANSYPTWVVAAPSAGLRCLRSWRSSAIHSVERAGCLAFVEPAGDGPPGNLVSAYVTR